MNVMIFFAVKIKIFGKEFVHIIGYFIKKIYDLINLNWNGMCLKKDRNFYCSENIHLTLNSIKYMKMFFRIA